MRIGIDAHYVGVRPGGNESYFEQLLNALARAAREGDEHFVFSYRNAARARLDGGRLRLLPLHRRSVYWQRAVEIPRYARRLDLDVLHVPFNFLPVSRCRKIVSIHDLAFEYLPAAYAPVERARMRLLTRAAARRADHVLTLSAYSKRSIVERYRIPAEQVTVVPGAVRRDVFRAPDRETIGRQLERLGIPPDYLLYVGAIQRRKNLTVLLAALRLLRARGRHDVPLVLVGRKGWGAGEVFRAVSDQGLTDRVRFVERADTEALVALYGGALALVLPSLFEGFGMPVLEAMSCGCPVVSSDATSLPEVCGEAALLFDPRSPEALADRLATLLDDGSLRRTLVERGRRNCDRFSWERAAALADAVYHAA